jgi:hypothetical protein
MDASVGRASKPLFPPLLFPHDLRFSTSSDHLACLFFLLTPAGASHKFSPLSAPNVEGFTLRGHWWKFPRAMRSRVPVHFWAFRVTSRYGARVSIIIKLKSLTYMISHGQQRNEERDAPSSELRYISGPSIDGLGNLNECTRWCRYIPLSLASLCPHAVSHSFLGSITISARTATARWRVPYSCMRSVAVLPSSHRGAHRRCPNGDHVHRITRPSYGFFGRMPNILCHRHAKPSQL